MRPQIKPFKMPGVIGLMVSTGETKRSKWRRTAFTIRRDKTKEPREPGYQSTWQYRGIIRQRRFQLGRLRVASVSMPIRSSVPYASKGAPQ